MLIKILSLLFLFGCNQEYDCEELSMQIYRGAPTSRQKFDQNCKGVKVRYTQELCQEALKELVHTSSLDATKEKFGAPVQNCFTSNDLKRFNKDKI